MLYIKSLSNTNTVFLSNIEQDRSYFPFREILSSNDDLKSGFKMQKNVLTNVLGCKHLSKKANKTVINWS